MAGEKPEDKADVPFVVDGTGPARRELPTFAWTWVDPDLAVTITRVETDPHTAARLSRHAYYAKHPFRGEVP